MTIENKYVDPVLWFLAQLSRNKLLNVFKHLGLSKLTKPTVRRMMMPLSSSQGGAKVRWWWVKEESADANSAKEGGGGHG